MRTFRLFLLVFGILGTAFTLVKDWLEIKKASPPAAGSVAPAPVPAQSTVVVIGANVVPPAPPIQQRPAATIPPGELDAGFNGRFVSNRGLSYEFDQKGPQINVYLLHPDGRRRYVGEAYDEGARLRFKSFYSPVYERWGNFPTMYRRGATLVSINDDGSETVFFTREG